MPKSASGFSKMDDEAPTPRPIKPGEPELENVFFVVLGVVLMILVIYRLAVLL